MREKVKKTAEKKPPSTLGIITRLLPEEGYGWVRADGGTPDDPTADYFFHARAVRGSGFDDPEKFYEGARVRFIATDSPKGPRALAVEAVEGEEVDGNKREPLPEDDDAEVE
jgi:cold shock CspA family protein